MIRQTRKQRLTFHALAAAAILGIGQLAALAPATADDEPGPPPAELAPPPAEVVVNPLTGVAIDGMDPVSYFTESEPLRGSPDFEYVWAGVPWYFASEANRQVFARAPWVYAPRFGGFGTTALARGFLSDGSPRIYAVFSNRLYFFYSAGNRQAFDAAKVAVIEAAEQAWLTTHPPAAVEIAEPAP